MDDYTARENPMVSGVMDYHKYYDEDFENEKWAYQEDAAWEDYREEM